MSFIVKQHITQQGFLMLAVCDKNLLGKKFEEGKLQLDLTASFYKGNRADEQELLKLLKKTNQSNFVGEFCIAIAIKNNFLSKDNIKHIAGIPYANMCQIDENREL